MRKCAQLLARLASALLVWSEDQPSTSLFPRTAPARELHNSTPTRSSYRSPPLQSYKACQDVHNRSRAGLPPHPLQSRAPHSNRSPERCTFRVLGNLVLTCIRPWLPRKSSFAACKDVHDCSRSQSGPNY
ncbi:hypothetical protein BJV77DRAFT_1051943 [Russula vinacea]|nr:hypothetical protein BJV77DRAFT_1051943 [Russula vinacea]